MSERINILTPVGRMVAGHPLEGQTTDAEGRPLVFKTGPQAGQPRVNYYVGLAIAKTDPGWPELHAKIQEAAKIGFPNLFPAGNCIAPNFAFKITDGDSDVPNTKGVAPVSREGYAGHWVLNFSSSIEPKCYETGGKALITDKNKLNRGNYVRIYGNVAGNGSQQQPGVYLNLSHVEFCGYGQEIYSGPNPEDIFKNAGALPVGASATPVAPATPMPGATTPPVVTPPPPVTPAHDIVTPPAPPAPPTAAPVRKFNVNGKDYTYEQLIGFGWTDEQIKGLNQLPF